MKKSSPEIVELRKRIEESLGRKMAAPSDFDYLSIAIWERTHENLSTSTLKRIWGYVEGNHIIRRSSLEILSKFLNFNSWDDFLALISQDNDSDWENGLHFRAEDLKINDLVIVAWKPNRHCTFRYLGNQQFVVDTAENSKLNIGDSFHCNLFILGKPLYLNDLIQNNNPPSTFVAGSKGGLCELKIQSTTC